MIERRLPAGFVKAREFAARVPSPVGKPFAAAKKGETVELYLYDGIGHDPYTDTGIDPQDVIAAVADARGAASLDVHINSPGGFVFDGIAIFNAIRAFKGKKTIYVDGVAASIASIIALAGDRVVTNEGAMWMIHDPMSGIFAMGTAEEIEEDARKTVNALRKVRETLLDVYTNATGRPLSEISAWMASETWMTADEAKERGFTHEVAKKPREHEHTMAATNAPVAETRSPQTIAALARAKAQALREQFSGAGPGTPGGPGSTQAPASAGKGK